MNRDNDQESDTLEPTSNKECTIDTCIDDEDKKLQCSMCKRRVHLRCTLLPPYQLQRYLTFGRSYCQYICANCVEVPQYLEKIKPRKQNEVFREKYEQELDKSSELKTEVATLTEKVKNQAEELRTLQQTIHNLTEDNAIMMTTSQNKQKQKKRRINEETSVDSDEEFERKEKEIERLKQQNENLNERLDERENELHDVLQKMAAIDCPTNISNESKLLLGQIEKSIKERFDTMQNTFTKMIDEKFDVNAKVTDDKLLSYAATVTKNITETTNSSNSVQEDNQIKTTTENYRSLMMSTRNEELAEQREKRERACNIIVHGREENNDLQPDNHFIQRLLQNIDENVSPKQIVRIGRSEGRRPIKVILESEADKDQIMENLRNLKGIATYKGISITEDYTLSERKMIKEFNDKARERTYHEEEDYEWRLRGTPKKGLFLKRFKIVPRNQ